MFAYLCHRLYPVEQLLVLMSYVAEVTYRSSSCQGFPNVKAVQQNEQQN